MQKSNWIIYSAGDYRPDYGDSREPKYSGIVITHGPDQGTISIGFSPEDVRLNFNPRPEGVIYLELSEKGKKLIFRELDGEPEKSGNFRKLIDKINGELLISL